QASPGRGVADQHRRTGAHRLDDHMPEILALSRQEEEMIGGHDARHIFRIYYSDVAHLDVRRKFRESTLALDPVAAIFARTVDVEFDRAANAGEAPERS